MNSCPKCGNPSLEKTQSAQLVASLLGTAGVMMWIPILGWVLIPFLLAGAALVSLVGILTAGKRYCYCGWSGR